MIRQSVVAERAVIGGAHQNLTRTAKFYFWLFLVGIATFIWHEAAHWVVGTALGYDMQPRLNSVRASTSVLPPHQAIIDAAGPVATVLQAGVGFAVVLRKHASIAFTFVYMAAFMRLLATAVSLFNANDEARLGMYFGIGKWTLPIIVSAGLLVLVWKSSRYLHLTWKEHLLCYLVASASISLVVGIDRFVF